MKIHPPAGVRKIEMRYDEQNRRGRACLARKRRSKRRPYTWPIRRGAASGAPTIDKGGVVRYAHVGEGAYNLTEQTIVRLLVG